MDPSLRERLEHLAAQLHLVRDTSPAAGEAHDEVSRALAGDHDGGLGERLRRSAVALESDHPALSDVIRRVIDDLGAAGL